MNCPMCGKECQYAASMVCCCDYSLHGDRSVNLTAALADGMKRAKSFNPWKVNLEEFLDGMEFTYNNRFVVNYKDHRLTVMGDFWKCMLLIDLFKFILRGI